MLGEGEGESDCNSCVPAYLRDGADDGEGNGGLFSLLGAALFFFLFLLIILGAIAFLVSKFYPGLAETLGVRNRKCELRFCSIHENQRLLALTLITV